MKSFVPCNYNSLILRLTCFSSIYYSVTNLGHEIKNRVFYSVIDLPGKNNYGSGVPMLSYRRDCARAYMISMLSVCHSSKGKLSPGTDRIIGKMRFLSNCRRY